MKSIEKSPAVYVYECEKCHVQFNSEVEAITCEENHAEAIGFTSKKYESQYKYPTSVSVRMNDSSIQTYRFTTSAADDILENVTSEGRTVIAIVDAYDVVVQKEYVKDEETVVENITGANVKLENKVLYVDIPDNIPVLSTDTICVKVFNEQGVEVVIDSNNSVFENVVITAEVKQVIDNDCIE